MVVATCDCNNLFCFANPETALETHATAYADLVLAVRSAYFIGNPASSFSANVVMIRRALGAAPESTNLRVLDFPRPASFNEQFA